MAVEADAIQVPLWRVRLNLWLKSFRNSWSLFAQNPIGLLGLGIILFYGLFALAHPILINTVWDPVIYHPVSGFDITIPFHPASPSARHLLGTDPLGRDVLSQLMFSTRYEFALGLIAAIVTMTIATTIGAVTAYFGGAIDMVLMRVVNLVMMV
ncbi:MAG: ABC transporter permease, partial [Anaerolineae bacterium]